MIPDEIKKALDRLDKFDFFNQRAGRELWNDKPTNIQNEDIDNYSKDIEFLKSFINRQQAEIEKLNNIVAYMDDFARSICKIRMSKGKLIANSEDLLTYIQEKECKAIKEFAEKVKQLFAEGDGAIIDIDNLLNKW